MLLSDKLGYNVQELKVAGEKNSAVIDDIFVL